MKKSLAMAVGAAFLIAAGLALAQEMKAPMSKPDASASQSESPLCTPLWQTQRELLARAQ